MTFAITIAELDPLGHRHMELKSINLEDIFAIFWTLHGSLLGKEFATSWSRHLRNIITYACRKRKNLIRIISVTCRSSKLVFALSATC